MVTAYCRAILEMSAISEGGLMEFDWDEGNLGEIRKHGLTPTQVEQAVRDSKRRSDMFTLRNGERRGLLYGITDAGLVLMVPWVRRGNRFRPITAYPVRGRKLRYYQRRP